MGEAEKVVVRFLDGTMLKGMIRNFSAEGTELHLEERETGNVLHFSIVAIKAVFFVKTFAGDPGHREKKLFGARADAEELGRKIYIKFKDGENLYGFFKGDIPWKQGYFVADSHSTAQGFFITPTDSDSNNIRIFVVGSAIKDITAIVP